MFLVYNEDIRRNIRCLVVVMTFFDSFSPCRPYCGYGQCQIELKEHRQCYFEGEDVSLECQLKDDSFDMQNVTIKYENLDENMDFVRHEVLETKVLNNSTVQTIVSNVTVKDAGIYYCYYNNVRNNPIDNYFDDTQICILENYQIPDTITCQLHNAETLECFWNGLADVCWNLRYRPMTPTEDYQVCNKSAACSVVMDTMESDFKCCSQSNTFTEIVVSCGAMSYSIDELKKGFLLDFVLTGSFFTSTKSRKYKIKIETTIAKVDPVQNLKAFDITSSSALLRWTMTHDVCNYETTCNVDVSSLYSYKIATKKTKCMDRLEEFHLSSLKPFKRYLITVACKIEGALYWSETRSINITTLSSRPLRGPRTNVGSFHLQRRTNSDTVLLAIYWAPTDRAQARGVIDQYKVQVDPIAVKHFFKPDTITGVIEIPNIPFTKYLVSIWSFINDVESLEPSQVAVTINKNIPSTSSVYVKMASVPGGNTRYMVIWNCRYKMDDITVTIYWCSGYIISNDMVFCQSHLNWERISGSPHNKFNVTLPTPALSDNTTWYFGVAVIKDNVSTGIKWHDCVYSNLQDDCYNSIKIEDITTSTNADIYMYILIVISLSVLILVFLRFGFIKAKTFLKYDPDIDTPKELLQWQGVSLLPKSKKNGQHGIAKDITYSQSDKNINFFSDIITEVELETGSEEDNSCNLQSTKPKQKKSCRMASYLPKELTKTSKAFFQNKTIIPNPLSELLENDIYMENYILDNYEMTSRANQRDAWVPERLKSVGSTVISEVVDGRATQTNSNESPTDVTSYVLSTDVLFSGSQNAKFPTQVDPNVNTAEAVSYALDTEDPAFINTVEESQMELSINYSDYIPFALHTDDSLTIDVRNIVTDSIIYTPEVTSYVISSDTPTSFNENVEMGTILEDSNSNIPELTPYVLSTNNALYVGQDLEKTKTKQNHRMEQGTAQSESILYTPEVSSYVLSTNVPSRLDQNLEFDTESNINAPAITPYILSLNGPFCIEPETKQVSNVKRTEITPTAHGSDDPSCISQNAEPETKQKAPYVKTPETTPYVQLTDDPEYICQSVKLIPTHTGSNRTIPTKTSCVIDEDVSFSFDQNLEVKTIPTESHLNTLKELLFPNKDLTGTTEYVLSRKLPSLSIDKSTDYNKKQIVEERNLKAEEVSDYVLHTQFQ